VELYSNVVLYESTVNEISYNSHLLLNRQKTMIILETNMGEIHINVDANKAPITAKNFTDYVVDGFFEGYHFPPCHSKLYDSRWWYDRRYATKTN